MVARHDSGNTRSVASLTPLVELDVELLTDDVAVVARSAVEDDVALATGTGTGAARVPR